MKFSYVHNTCSRTYVLNHELWSWTGSDPGCVTLRSYLTLLSLSYSICKMNLTLTTSLVAQMVKNLWKCRRPGFSPWVGKILWRRKWHPTPVLLPGKSHGQRSVVGYSPRGRKDSDTTERLHFHFLSRNLAGEERVEWYIQSAERKKSAKQDYFTQHSVLQKWTEKAFPKQTKFEGVHHY